MIFYAFVERNDEYERDLHYIMMHKNLGARLSGMGFSVLDLYPLHQAKMREMGWRDLSEWYVAGTPQKDAHPNAEGHQFIAEKLVEHTLRQPALKEVFENARP